VDINTEVGVVHDIQLQELRLYTDFGRCCRPLFIVDRQALRIKKSHIRMLQGLVEEQKLVWQARPRPGRPRAPPPPRRPRSSRLLLICLTACALLNPRHSGSSAAPSSVRRVPFTARPGTPARGRARPAPRAGRWARGAGAAGGGAQLMRRGAQDLVYRGFIEYVDTEEEETTMIAMELRDLRSAAEDHRGSSPTCARPYPMTTPYTKPLLGLAGNQRSY
jgi:hypothetical protein